MKLMLMVEKDPCLITLTRTFIM